MTERIILVSGPAILLGIGLLLVALTGTWQAGIWVLVIWALVTAGLIGSNSITQSRRSRRHGTITLDQDRAVMTVDRDVAVDLAEVRHINWCVSAFSRTQTVRITLWDRPSSFIILGVDVLPEDPSARELAEIRVPDLLAQPEIHRRFCEYFAPRIAAGTVSTAVDLTTLQPTRAAHNTIAPGFVRFKDRLIYSPALADTERRLRSE